MASHSSKARRRPGKLLRNLAAGRHGPAKKEKLEPSYRTSIVTSKAYPRLALVAWFSIVMAFTAQKSSAEELPSAPQPHTASSPSEKQKAVAALRDPAPFSSNTSPGLIYEGISSTVHPVSKPRIADSKFFVMNGLHLGFAIIDVELTQHCLASHQCREGNPLMPSSQAGQLSIGIGYVSLAALASYQLKKHKSPYWCLPPAGGIAGHTAGIITGLDHK